MAIDFRARHFLRPIATPRLRRALERTQWMPDEDRAEYRAARLSEVLEVARSVPHYQAVLREAGITPEDLRGEEGLRCLPVLQKADLRAHPERLVRPGAPDGPWSRTSGTTGEPVRFRHDLRSNQLEFCFYWRWWSWAGYRIGDRFMELGSVHFSRPGRDADALTEWQPVARRLLVNAARVSPGTAKEILAACHRRRPRFLKGLPSALCHLASCLELSGPCELGFDAVFSTGELVTPAARMRIERAFGCRLFDAYGHMERTVAIAQCQHGRYHVNDDYGLLEVSDERHLAEGVTVASVLGTSLHNLVMPLLRYETGDEVELDSTERPCPCGRTLPTVRAIRGRLGDAIRTPDGRHLSAACSVFDSVEGVSALQLHQERMDLVRVLIVPGPGFDESRREEILTLGRRFLGAGVRLELSTCSPLDLTRSDSGKLLPLVSCLKEP